MMDHKTILNRDAKAEIMLLIAEIRDEKRDALIEKYKCNRDPISRTAQKVLIGNWFTNAVKMLQKGATEEELKRIAEHINVLMCAIKYRLDIRQSYDDRDLLGLSRKYFAVYKKIKTKDGEIIYEKETPLEKRKRLVEEAKEKHEKLKERIMELREQGLEIHEMAEKLNKPESTIRNMIMKN